MGNTGVGGGFENNTIAHRVAMLPTSKAGSTN